MTELGSDGREWSGLPRVHPAARPRPRLMDRLDRWSPLTVLHAPGGAGKTTAAVHWARAARERGERVGWYDAAAAGPDPVTVLATLGGHGGRAALVVEHADALGLEGLLRLTDLVRRDATRHLVLCLRAEHAVVLRLRTEVETQVLTGADLALDAAELADLPGQGSPDVLAWTGGHVGTVVSGMPAPGAGGGWSRERARAYLGVRLDELGPGAWPGLALLAALGEAPVDSRTVGELTAGLGGDPLHDLQQVADVEVADDGLLLRLPPALREVLRDRVGPAALGPELVGQVLRQRWWELLRDDPELLRGLVATLPDTATEAGSLATQLRREGLVGLRAEGADVATPTDLGACAVRVLATRRRGDLAAATWAVRRGEALLAVTSVGDPAVVRRFALEAGLACLETGDLGAARGWWLRVHAGSSVGDPEAAALLALVAAIEGDHEALASWRDRAGAGRSEALRLVLAIDAVDRGDLREAGRQLAVLSQPGPAGDLWYLVAAVRAEIAVMGPARSEALHVLRTRRAQLAHRAPVGSFARCVLDLAETTLLLAGGRATEAATVLDWRADGPVVHLLRGRLALMTGDLDGALAELAAVAHPPTSPRRLRLEALLLIAETHRRAGRDASAREVSEQLAVRAPWPRLLDLLPGGPVHPGTLEIVQLTARERELLDLLPGPLPRDSIASALFVSTNTVKTQLQALYRKLDAATREEAVARAFELGLLD